jgi:hypothetical protein
MPIQVQRGRKYSCNSCKSSVLVGVVGQHDGVLSLHLQKRTVTHCTGGWVGPGAGMGVHKILYSTGNRSPDRQLIASHCTIYVSPAVLLGVDGQ